MVVVQLTEKSVSFNTIIPGFESRHQQILGNIYYLLVDCLEMTKRKGVWHCEQ